MPKICQYFYICFIYRLLFNIHKKEQFMKTLQIIKQDQDKTISLVEHETSHTKYIQKELNYYDKTLYQTLQ